MVIPPCRDIRCAKDVAPVFETAIATSIIRFTTMVSALIVQIDARADPEIVVNDDVEGAACLTHQCANVGGSDSAIVDDVMDMDFRYR